MVDSAKKGRSLKVLTKQLVAEIVKAKGTQKGVAKKFGISQAMVSFIKSGARHQTVEVIP
jgi:predicted transcriptional regulator